MADILIRNVPDDLKQRLEQRAADNGRSRNAETIAILEEALAPQRRTWFDILREAVDEVGGVELERPTWAPPREVAFE